MHGTHVEVSGLRGFSRRSARLPGWAAALASRDESHSFLSELHPPLQFYWIAWRIEELIRLFK